MRVLRGIGRFWYDFIVGDDPKVAGVVVACLALGAALVVSGVMSGSGLAVLLAATLLAGFAAIVLVDARRPDP